MNTTVRQKQKKASTRPNCDTSSSYTKQKLSKRQYAYDDSGTNPTMIFPYECFLSGERYSKGAVYAGSPTSAKLIAEARHPEACEVRVGRSYEKLISTS